jgi:hypothetical protein
MKAGVKLAAVSAANVHGFPAQVHGGVATGRRFTRGTRSGGENLMKAGVKLAAVSAAKPS